MGLFNRKAKAATDVDAEVRSELPIVGSPYQSVSAIAPIGLSDTAVSVERAMTLTAVNRCVSILSTDVAQLPLLVYSNGAVVPQPSTSIAIRPNAFQSLYAFMEETVNSLAVYGNFYWLNDKQSPDTVLSKTPVKNLVVLDPSVTSIEHDQDGNKWFRSGKQKYPAYRVTHGKHTRLPGYTYGVGPIQLNQNELRGALDVRNYADNWFRESKMPLGYLKFNGTGTLTPEKAEAAIARVEEFVTGESRILVLGSDWEYVTLTLNPADAQFLENQQFLSAQIARMFGVPSIKLGLPGGGQGSSMTYTNAQEVNLSYVQDTLMRYIKEIETAYSDLFPRGTDVVFNLDGLLRADVYTQGGGNGTPDSTTESSANAS